jgi:hypothetical protein
LRLIGSGAFDCVLNFKWGHLSLWLWVFLR